MFQLDDSVPNMLRNLGNTLGSSWKSPKHIQTLNLKLYGFRVPGTVGLLFSKVFFWLEISTRGEISYCNTWFQFVYVVLRIFYVTKMLQEIFMKQKKHVL